MRFLYSLAAAVSLVLVTSCSTVPRGEDLSVLNPPKSFAFLPDKTMIAADEAGLSNAPYWHGKVEEAIAVDLTRKGYTLVSDPRAGQLLVAMHVITQRGDQTTFLDNYSGYTLSAKEQAEQPEIETFLKTPGNANRSILIIDVIDPQQRVILWRDWTQAPLRKHPSAKTLERGITRAVHRILSGFPPKP